MTNKILFMIAAKWLYKPVTIVCEERSLVFSLDALYKVITQRHIATVCVHVDHLIIRSIKYSKAGLDMIKHVQTCADMFN